MADSGTGKGNKVGEMFVELAAHTQPFDRGLQRSQVRFTAFGNAMMARTAALGAGMTSRFASIAAGMAGAFGMSAGVGVAASLGMAFTKAITGASDLNETTSKLGVIFGDSAKTVISASDGMADKFGIVKTEFMDSSAEIGNLLQQMGGMSAQAAAEMSVNLTKAAGDASSIFNKSFGDAAMKIKAAILGSSEPISDFGVDTQEVAVKAEAMRMGLVRGTRELTVQEKVAARASLVLNGLKVAEGDLANTSTGFANSSRALWGRLQNTLASLGQAIMPIVEMVTGALNKMLVRVQGLVDRAKPYIESFSASFIDFASYASWAAGQVWDATANLAAKFEESITSTDAYKASVIRLGQAWEWLKGVAQEVFETVRVVFNNWSSIMAEAGVRAMGWATNLGEIMAYAGGVVGTFGSWFADNFTNLLIDALNAQLTAFRNVFTNIKDLIAAVMDFMRTGRWEFDFTPLLDGFRAATEKFPEIAKMQLSSVQDEIDAIRSERDKAIQEQEDARHVKKEFGDTSGQGKKPGSRGTGAMTPKKVEKSEFVGLAEFAKKIQVGSLSKNQAEDRTAINTGRIAAEVAGLRGDIRAGIPARAAGPA